MNRHPFIASLFFAFLAFTVQAALPALKLKVEVAGCRVVLGEPVTVTVSLRGGGDFQLAEGFGPCDGGLLRVIVANENGGGDVQMASDTPSCPQVTHAPGGTLRSFPYHRVAEFTYHFWLLPGAYTVQARYHSERQSDASAAPYWTGSLSADTVRFQVDDPQGEDLHALQAFNLAPGKTPVKSYVPFIQRNSQELLRRFPTSRYAGYAVYEKYKNMIPGTNTPETAAVGDTARSYAERLVNPRKDPSVPDYRAQPEVRRQQMDQMEQALGSHSDFHFRSGLYLLLGIEQMEGGQFSGAVLTFNKCLNSEPTPQVADTAKIYLEVLNKYGWK